MNPRGGAGGEPEAAALGLIPGQQVIFQVGVEAQRRQADASAAAAQSRGEQALAVGAVIATGVVAVGSQPVEGGSVAGGGLQIHLGAAHQAKAGIHGEARSRQSRLLAVHQPQHLILVVGHHHPLGIDGDGAGGIAGANVKTGGGGVGGSGGAIKSCRNAAATRSAKTSVT